MLRILIFTNTHVIRITLVYTVYIHELWVTVGQLDAVASSVMPEVLHQNRKAVGLIPASGSYMVAFSQLLLVRSNKCIKFTFEISIYEAYLHLVLSSEVSKVLKFWVEPFSLTGISLFLNFCSDRYSGKQQW
jgi:hypothetical protein